MAGKIFSDGQTFKGDDIFDWWDDTFDRKGRRMFSILLARADPVVILDKRANRALLPPRAKHKALLTFDDGQTAYADDVLKWIAGQFDWVCNPILIVFFGHAKPMAVSDNEFNRALLSPVRERWADRPIAVHGSGRAPPDKAASLP